MPESKIVDDFCITPFILTEKKDKISVLVRFVSLKHVFLHPEYKIFLFCLRRHGINGAVEHFFRLFLN